MRASAHAHANEHRFGFRPDKLWSSSIVEAGGDRHTSACASGSEGADDDKSSTAHAVTAGTYLHSCAVPGHTQRGMVGTFVVVS